MKFSTVFLSTATLFLAVLPIPSRAHLAMSYPPTQAGPWSSSPNKLIHTWIGYEGKKYPCGQYKPGPVTTLSAGQVIKTRLWNWDIKDYKKFPPPSSTPQARHGGGSCEFSLSYDGGSSWHVIAQYTKTCGDIFYEWPVLIPQNIKSCTDSNKCLFAFTWIAALTPQFYMSCANVVINGSSTGVIPPLKLTVVDVTQLGQKQNVGALGDGKSDKKSTGPSSTDLKRNLSNYYTASTKVTGVSLNLFTGGKKRRSLYSRNSFPDFEKRRIGEAEAKAQAGEVVADAADAMVVM